MDKLNKFLEWFHDGSETEYNKILSVFNTTRRFLQIIVKYNKQDEIDVSYIPNKEWRNDNELFDFIANNGFFDHISYSDLDNNVRNYYLLWSMNKDTDSTLKYICDNLLTDVEPRDDGYWLRLRDREELSEFFRLEDIARQVLSEEGLGYEYFFNTTEDVYDDVIEELNEKNIQLLANYILKHIGNTDLSVEDYESDFFKELAEVQARDGVFQITSDDVGPLIGDSEAMNELLNADLSDLNSELYSIHSNAYNSAYENMIYEDVMSGLEEYFIQPIDDVARKIGEKTTYISYIKIRDFYSNVMRFIDVNLGETWNESVLEYFGSYTGMMKQLFYEDVYESIDFRLSDYPDYDEVRKGINEYFGDYI